MKSKFFACVFFGAGVSQINAMSEQRNDRCAERFPLLDMVLEEGSQASEDQPFADIPGLSQSADDFQTVHRDSTALRHVKFSEEVETHVKLREERDAETRNIVYEALKAVGVDKPEDVKIKFTPYYCLWNSKKPIRVNCSGIFIKLDESDKRLLEFYAYEAAVQWQINHDVSEYAPDSVKIGSHYKIKCCAGSALVLMGCGITGLIRRDVPLLVGGFGGAAVALGAIVRIAKNDENNYLEQWHAGFHAARILCKNNKIDIVHHMISALDNENVDHVTTIFDNLSEVRAKRKAVLQRVCDEHESMFDAQNNLRN